jgi:hypothetical protein
MGMFDGRGKFKKFSGRPGGWGGVARMISDRVQPGADRDVKAQDWLKQFQGMMPPPMPQGQMPQGQPIPQFQPQFQQQVQPQFPQQGQPQAQQQGFPQGQSWRGVGLPGLMQASQAYQQAPVNIESPLARLMRMYGGG